MTRAGTGVIRRATRVIRRAATVLAVCAVVLGVWRLADAFATTGFHVVRVEGELTAAERGQVRDAVNREIGAGSPTVADVVDVVEGLDWVRHVYARRVWPDALHIVVAHETPAARWGEDAWLSSDGSVVPNAALGGEMTVANLPTIAATRADGVQAMEVFNRISEVAASEGLAIAELTESAAGDWTATLSTGVRVVLGHTAFAERMRRFVAVYRAHLSPQAAVDAEPNRVGMVASADARYTNGVAVRWLRPQPPDQGEDGAGDVLANALAANVAADWPPAGRSALGD